MMHDSKLATVVRADPAYLVVRDQDGELHYLGYHGQVRPDTPREAGASVRLHWSSGTTWSFPVVTPVD